LGHIPAGGVAGAEVMWARGAATAAANHIKEMSRYVRPQANKYKKYS